MQLLASGPHCSGHRGKTRACIDGTDTRVHDNLQGIRCAKQTLIFRPILKTVYER